jgi:hypothetical protein
MNVFFVSLLFLLQGIPIQPTQGGTVVGVLRNSDGKPAPGVRVAALPQTQFAADAGDAATLSSIAETDEQGRYSLENVPPGRYYIAAGRLDLQTYFPGTQAMNAALPVRVEPGAKVQGIDFVLVASSAGRSISFGASPGLFVVPLNVIVEGGKLPVSANGKPTVIKLSSAATGDFWARLIEPNLSEVDPVWNDATHRWDSQDNNCGAGQYRERTVCAAAAADPATARRACDCFDAHVGCAAENRRNRSRHSPTTIDESA